MPKSLGRSFPPSSSFVVWGIIYFSDLSRLVPGTRVNVDRSPRLFWPGLIPDSLCGRRGREEEGSFLS